MNKHKAMPNIRFKGFEDEWKEKKFGSLFNHNSGTSIEKYFNSDGKYKVISIGSYGKNSKYIDQGIRVDLNSVTKSHLVDKNDLTMVLNDKTSDGQIIGRVLLINKSNEYVINQRTERLIPRNINSKFAFIYLNGPIRKSIKKMVQGGTQIYVNYSSIEKINAIVPKTMEEQRKIGDLFSRLDKLLDLQQQKIDKLELLKKALLQKLFPKHDAKIPELRFKGYDGEWEKEKLSKFGHTFSGLSGKTKKDFGHGKAKYITYMNVFKNPLTSKTELDDIEVDSKQHTVKYGDVLFTMSSETPDEVGMSSVWKYHLENIYLNSFSFGYRHSTKCDLNFLAFMFRSQVVREQIKILAQGISRYNISKNKMMDILAYFPTESEQQKIGNLLSKVDQLIELENKKLQNLQQVKKCLLQNMFVG